MYVYKYWAIVVDMMMTMILFLGIFCKKHMCVCVSEKCMWWSPCLTTIITDTLGNIVFRKRDIA